MDSFFDDNIKEEIRLRADIASIVGRYVTLKGSGQTLKGLCPFHKEKTPSFHVNPSKGFFYCFGCGKGGDIYTFLQEIEGIGFSDALKMLAEETGVEIKKSKIQHKKQFQDNLKLTKTDMFRIHEICARFFYNNIRKYPQSVEYFKSRQLHPQTVRDFRLGFAPPEWANLITFCSKEQINVLSLVSCGLAVEKDSGSTYDRFRNRVIFSLIDLSGRVIGFAGRGLEKDAIPKYLNSPETLIYQKKSFLYGLYQARTAIKEKGYAIVVEGYMDHLTLYQSAIHNVVATSGTAFTSEHAHLLSRFTSKIVLVFDGDEAGQSAAKRAIPILVQLDLDVSILILPDKHDPDSYIKSHSSEKFLFLIANSRKWTTFIIEKTIEEHDISSIRGKSAVINNMEPLYRSMKPLLKPLFVKEVAEYLLLKEEDVLYRLKSPNKTAVRNIFNRNESIEEYDINSLESTFLRILFTKPELIREAMQFVVPETVTDSVSSDIYSLMIETYNQNGNLNRICDRTDNSEIKRIISLLLVKPALEDHVNEELVQKIVHLRAKFLRFKLREIQVQMKKEPKRCTELLCQLQDYSTQLKNLGEGE